MSDSDEMRVIQCRCGSRLCHESLETIRIARCVLTEDLERQITAEHGVFGEVDLPMPPRAIRRVMSKRRIVVFDRSSSDITRSYLTGRAPSRIVVIM